MKVLIFIVMFGLGGSPVWANPLGFLKREIRKSGYILYRNPLSSAGTGTLVGGSPNSVSIIADPQTCFPDQIDGKETLIRRVEDTNLGSISQTTQFEGRVGVDLIKFMNNGNSMFKIGVGGESIQSIELSFEDAKIEYIDTILLMDFYRNHMNEACKKILDKVGFVIQALRVNKMRYAFKNKTGGYLKLTMDGISEYLDINADVKYHIEQDYQLVIDTPKYIGYQLGRLREKDQGLSLYRAHRTFLNRYLFRSLSIFQN